MPASQSPSPIESQNSADGSMRKRVGKACDRCRLKKSKCDGMSVCSRCRADNAICVFGERKKSHDKVYPKGYVEMLEQQQSQLVAGLQEMYRRSQNGQGWKGAPLSDSNGIPLTHDILDRLGALKSSGQSSLPEGFEEDLSVLQRRLLSTGAGYMQRAQSDTESDAGQSPTSYRAGRTNSLADPHAHSRLPPTPPEQSADHFSSPRMSPSSFPDLMDDTSTTHQTWASAGINFDEALNSPFQLESPVSMEGLASPFDSPMPTGTIAPYLSMRNFVPDADFQRYFSVGAM